MTATSVTVFLDGAIEKGNVRGLWGEFFGDD